MCACAQFAKKMGVGFGEVNTDDNRNTAGRATFSSGGRLRWEERWTGPKPEGYNPTYFIETKDGLTYDQRLAREKRNNEEILHGKTPPKTKPPEPAEAITPPAGRKYTQKYAHVSPWTLSHSGPWGPPALMGDPVAQGRKHNSPRPDAISQA